jgi:hypothetical protein
MVEGCFAFSALLSVRTLARREDFGLRWQPAEAKRSEDWSAAATPLFDCGPNFQSGVAPAPRDSRRSPKRFGCGYAVLRSLLLKTLACGVFVVQFDVRCSMFPPFRSCHLPAAPTCLGEAGRRRKLLPVLRPVHRSLSEVGSRAKDGSEGWPLATGHLQI